MVDYFFGVALLLHASLDCGWFQGDDALPEGTRLVEGALGHGQALGGTTRRQLLDEHATTLGSALIWEQVAYFGL